tara:strand:+ start:692 stop:1021 length:330 start_codon:yes stop_codon:yes gene_type:complete
MKPIKLKNMDVSIEEILALLHNKKDGHKYECSISRPNEYDFRISIRKIVHDCFICKKETNKYNMEIRQDKRVLRLFTPKLICKSCLKGVDKLIDSLKLVQPRHLKELTR